MPKTPANSRRGFLKASVALPALGMIRPSTDRDTDPVFTALGSGDGPSGLLFSQVGYPTDYPVRVILRAPTRLGFGDSGSCQLWPENEERRYREPFKYWGERWGSHWWVATFADITETGEWTVEAEDAGRVIFREPGLRVAEDVLWEETYHWATVDMLLKRSYFTKVGSGWQDAGALWAESPAQSAMLICLTDVAKSRAEETDADYKKLLYAQIVTGANYLVLLEKTATERGAPPGATVHDVLGQEEYVLPNDTLKATVALYRAAAVLPTADFADEKKTYLSVADRCLNHLLTGARPIGDQGLARIQRGLPEDAPIPADEWPTRDLNFFTWACLEKYKAGATEYKDRARDYARQVMERQIGKDEKEKGYYGHFYEYASVKHSQKSWTHTILSSGDKTFGTDIGALFPNYLVPICEMLDLCPDDTDADRWRACLRDFTEGFLLPTTKLNPFRLVPLGIFGDEGPIWFTGPFHGTNAIYGYTAALACRMYKHLGIKDLKNVAAGNLQWIAGLNAGITTENIATGSVIYTTEVPDGIALPASMICRIGQRWAGTWFQTKGVVCNGFSVGAQFKLETFPKQAIDAPSSFTDEDWIPHSAGFLTGLMAWKDTDWR